MRRALLALLLVGCSREELAPRALEAGVDSSAADTRTEVGAEVGVDAPDTTVSAEDSAVEEDVGLVDSGEPDTRFASYPPWEDADPALWLTGPDAAPACDDAATDAEPGTRFCELYRDFFAHTGAASCQSYGCHGGDRGMQMLAMGWTARSMYDTFVAFKTWIPPGRLVTPVPGGDARPVSGLADALGAKHGYFMPALVPELGNRKLTDAEVARIQTWLARGAPFD